MRRVLCFILMLTASVLLLGCGNLDGLNATGERSEKEESGDVTLTFFAPKRQAPWEENDFTKHVEEKFGVRIKWSVAPEDAMKDKSRILLVSRDYPEVFLEGNFTRTDLLKYGQQGVLLPLNELIEKYAPNVRKVMDQKPYMRRSVTAPDGNIYALPRVNECYHCSYPLKYWINQEWLDKLGLSMPTTTDELYRVLKAFKEKDPNDNGEADEIPLTGAPSHAVWNGNIDAYLMNAFIYSDNDKYLYVSGGKVEFAADKPEWKQGLAYMNKLFREGLIDPASFTQSARALKQLGIGEGDEVVGSVTTASLAYLIDPYSDNPRQKHWVAVPPLKGPGGVQLAGYSQDALEFEFAITNKATPEQQVAAIRIADYMYSEEGALYSMYGPNEGIGWGKAKAGELNAEGEQAKYTFEGVGENVKEHNKGDRWELLGPINMSEEFRGLFATNQDPLSGKGYELRLSRATKLYEPYAPKEVYPAGAFIRPEDADMAAALTAAIKEYVQLNMAQFITGSKDLDKEWESYVNGFEGLNLSTYMEIYRRVMEVKTE
ncbi:extracellular solute-binding protein [Paenibacillus spongiae]|uniref:Extracellular solute-binding protein n=1 Tax=Paenibacillus spongiae TaxID=2909671 RepID=A0ABY5S8F2_9BACL|nr:extracellular solute-binding protein [Paenibacillus spongiae]UVI30181.1 extracellular solute-binding protein [Paenibacillus spongiae]